MGGMSQAKWAKKKAKQQRQLQQDKYDKVQYIPKGILKNRLADSAKSSPSNSDSSDLESIHSSES